MSVLRKLVLGALALLASGGMFEGPAASPGAVDQASGYLAARFDPASPANSAAETLVALAAAGSRDPVLEKAKAVIREKGPSEARSQAAYAGRIVMGLTAAGEDPRRFGATDYPSAILAAFDEQSGSFDRQNRIYANALAGLGLAAVGEPLPKSAESFMRANECAGGGFGHDPGCPTGADVDTTVMAASLLLSQGATTEDPVIERARLFLKVAQNPDGGFGLTPAYPTNSNSTGLALTLLAAIGEDPASWRSANGTDPRTALAALQNPDGGFRYRADRTGSNYYATVQAVTGLVPMVFPPSRRLLPDEPRPTNVPGSASARETTSGAVPTPSHPTTLGALPETPGRVTQMIVVRLPNGTSQTYCVHIASDSNGMDALLAAGVDVTTRDFGGSLGAAVCTIDGIGNSPGDCPGQGGHWHYWIRKGGRWVESETGPTSTPSSGSQPQAWTWSEGVSAIAPPEIDDGAPCVRSVPVAGTTSPGSKKPGPAKPELAALTLSLSVLGLIARARRGTQP